jgi:hypothetical protein
MLALIDDERHLCAFSLYQSLQERLNELDNASNNQNGHHGTGASSSPAHTRGARGVGGGANPFRRKGASEALEALAHVEHEKNAARQLLQSKAAVIDKLVVRQRRETFVCVFRASHIQTCHVDCVAG